MFHIPKWTRARWGEGTEEAAMMVWIEGGGRKILTETRSGRHLQVLPSVGPPPVTRSTDPPPGWAADASPLQSTGRIKKKWPRCEPASLGPRRCRRRDWVFDRWCQSEETPSLHSECRRGGMSRNVNADADTVIFNQSCGRLFSHDTWRCSLRPAAISKAVIWQKHLQRFPSGILLAGNTLGFNDLND